MASVVVGSAERVSMSMGSPARPEEGHGVEYLKDKVDRQAYPSAREPGPAMGTPTGRSEVRRELSSADTVVRAKAIARWENEGGRLLPAENARL